MRDVNLPLRKSYKTLLSELNLPVYYGEQPDSADNDVYIVYHTPNSTDASTYHSHDSDTTMQVDVYSKIVKGDSLNVDVVAADVMEKLIPAYGQYIEADGVQIISTRIINDRTDPPIRLGGVILTTRTLVFSHNIFIL